MPNQQLQSEDEIQLPGLRKIIKQFFQFIFWVIGYLTLMLFRNKFLVLAGLLLGLLLGYLYYTAAPNYYKATMVVQNNELAKRTYAEMLKQLSILASSSERLAVELNTSEEIAQNILFLDSKNMSNQSLSSDTSTRLRQPFKIIAGFRNVSSMDTLQKLLIDHLNNRPYLKKLREEQTKLSFDRLAFVEGELQKLDSLKREYNRFLGSSKISATFYNNAFNPAELYTQSTTLFNQRESTLRWLYVEKDAIVVLDNFKVRNSPDSIGLLKALLIFGFIGALVTFSIGFYMETRKRLGTSSN